MSLGCYDKIPWAGWLKQQILLTVLEAGKPEIQVLTDSVAGEDPFSGLQVATFFLGPHMVERESRQALFSSSSYKNTNPIMEGPIFMPSSKPITSQRSHLPVPSYWVLGLHHKNFRNMHIKSITVVKCIFIMKS